MFDFLALITGNAYWRLHSLLIRLILKAYGVRVGKGVHIRGVPKLRINGKASNIIIHDNVSILGDIDLRNRENGRIVIRENATIDAGCRIVAARDGTIEIGEGTKINQGAIINGGGNVIIGRECLLGPMAVINASEHIFGRNKPVLHSGYTYGDVVLEEDCWLGAQVVLVKGVRLGRGTVVGAGAVVRSDTEPYGVYVGVPARKVGERP